MKRNRALLALTAIVTASLVGLASPASATTAVASDTSGDVWLSRTDIVSVGASYGTTIITVAMGFARPTDPASWNSTTHIIWGVDVNGDGQEESLIFLGSGGTTLHHSDDLALICNGMVGYDGTLAFAHFEASCLGTPGGFQLVSPYANDSQYSDAADIRVGSCCWVTRDGAAPPPTTTTTTTQPPPPPPPVDPPVTTAGVHDGYWMLSQSGVVYGFGSARDATLNRINNLAFIHIEPTPTGSGYWVLNEGGSIVSKGDATGLNNIGVLPGEKAVSLSATPSGKGAWIFTDRGRVIVQGDAQNFGDMSGTPLNGAILGSVATPSGNGYWMVGSDGGVFSFGDAKFFGSTGDIKLNKPVMALAADPDGAGYWLVASDGGIFAFDATFYGSMGATPLNKPVSGMVPGAAGYMMVGEDGGIFSFGNVSFKGSLGASPPPSPVVSVALQP